MKTFIAIVVVAVACTIAFSKNVGTDQTKTAAQKLETYWSNVKSSGGKSADWPSTLSLAGIFLESMWPTGQFVDDVFPEGRKKLIHSVGGVAQFKFQWEKNDYTGLFQGADHGLIRVSSAIEPSDGGWFSDKNLTPGISIKMFRDGVPSANFFAMFQLDGQKDFNFFANNLCNHVPDRPDLPTKIKLLGKKFSSVSKTPGLVGLSDFAMYDQTGKKASAVKFPFALVFQANPDLTSQFSGISRSDLPQIFQESFTSAGTVLYKVYAVDAFTTSPPTALTYLGEVVTTSEFVATAYGDETLFFQHVFIETDFAIETQWGKDFNSADKYMQEEGVTRYEHLLPPWKSNDLKKKLERI